MNSDSLARLVGNPDVYALQNDDGSYTPVRKPLTKAVLQKHLTGQWTVGTYVNRKDEAKFVVFDIDSGSLVEATLINGSVLEMGVPPYAVGVEFSGRKGYHVWVLLQDWRPAHELRRFGRAVLALADVQCEVFPKQDTVRDLGNLVKLPGALHRVSKKRSEWQGAEPRPMPVRLWERAVVPNLPEELRGKSGADGPPNRFPCMEAIQSEGAPDGERNNSLFHLGTMLRRAGATEETVELVLRHVNEKCDPPLDEAELSTCIASSAHSGPICDSLPADRQCGELCIRARTRGLYTRPGQLRHAAVGENVVVELASRAGATVTFEHDDLATAKGALRQ